MLHNIITHCWTNQIFPSSWKQAFTILIYKKKAKSDPSNFRPITLQPILAKVYSSLIRNRMYCYLLDNDYIETKIQKGFWKSISGTIEHTELLSNIINNARIKQRQVIITLLDLKNAFGEVNHDLIIKALEYHHVPEELKVLIKNYYNGYNISIGTEDYTTDPIAVKKGVLQGDCLSPLLFNMIVNTLIKTIDDEKIKLMGYSYCKSLLPRHWFQFADDSAVVTSTEIDNQLLLNVFTKWCNWSGLMIKVDKCSTFGIKKNGSSSAQFKPYLRISNEMVPPTEINESFEYLGKSFSFAMKTNNIKSKLTDDLASYIETLNRLPLHPKNKLLIISKYVYSKLRWRFSIYQLSDTWVIQNLDSLVKEFVKRWLRLPQSANFTHLYLPSKMLGMKFSLPSDVYKSSQLATRNILKSSKNEEINNLYKLTQTKYVSEDVILSQSQPRKPSDRLVKETVQKICNELHLLQEQNSIISSITQQCTAHSLIAWQRVCESLPENIFVFIRKALIFSLCTNTNLVRWKKVISPSCNICNAVKQTQLHIFNNCSKAISDGRYKWRHDSILKTMCHYLSQLIGFDLFVDINGFANPTELFYNLRPDIVLLSPNEAITIELTCCFETNFAKSRAYKENRYSNLENDFKLEKRKFKKIFVEVSSLGFQPKQIREFKKLISQNKNINISRMLQKMSEVALRATFYIFTQRGNKWSNPELLNFI